MASSQEFEVVWPGGPMAAARQILARRPETLDGLYIAFVWDDVFRGDEIFPLLREEIARAFSDVRFVNYDAFGPTFGGEEHKVVERLPTLCLRSNACVFGSNGMHGFPTSRRVRR